MGPQFAARSGAIRAGKRKITDGEVRIVDDALSCRMAADQIRLRELDLPVLLGAEQPERDAWQNVRADVQFDLPRLAEEMRDDLEQTIDYSAVAVRLRAVAAERPRRLLETLAADLAACLAVEFGARGVVIELRKRVLPGLDHVGVRIERP